MTGKSAMCETEQWKLKVRLYKTGTVHLTLTNKATKLTKTMTIRRFRVEKELMEYIV